MDRATLRQYCARMAEGRNFEIGTITSMSTNNPRCSSLAIYPDDHFNDGEIYVYSGTAIAQSRRISDFASSNGEITPVSAFSPNALAADGFEVHRMSGWLTDQYNKVIDLAHYAAEDVYLTDHALDKITLEDERYEYPIPSDLRYLNRVQYATNYPTIGYSSLSYKTQQGLYVDNSNQQLSQAFVPTAAMHIGSVRLYLRKYASPTVNLTVDIQGNSSALPDGSALVSSGTVAASGIENEGSFVTFTFPRLLRLAADTTYHVVLRSSQGSLDATNYIAWGYDSATTYDDGNAGRYNGSSWSAIASSTFLFWLAYPDNEMEYQDFPLKVWKVLPGRILQLFTTDDGRPVRLIGQGQATLPTADSSTIYLPEAYLVPKVTALLMAMQPGGEVDDNAERLRFIPYYESIAEKELARMMTRVRPNSWSVSAR